MVALSLKPGLNRIGKTGCDSSKRSMVSGKRKCIKRRELSFSLINVSARCSFTLNSGSIEFEKAFADLKRMCEIEQKDEMLYV